MEQDGAYGSAALATAMDTQVASGEDTVPFYFGEGLHGQWHGAMQLTGSFLLRRHTEWQQFCL
jgi:hypothetical protein